MAGLLILDKFNKFVDDIYKSIDEWETTTTKSSEKSRNLCISIGEAISSYAAGDGNNLLQVA